MTTALLSDLRANTGGDYLTTKLLFNLAFYIKTSSTNTSAPGDIFLHEVIGENKVWEYTTFWTEFYWDSASAALASQVQKLVTDTEVYNDDQKVFLYELLYDHVQKMYEWGGLPLDVLSVFVESIGPLIDLTEDDEQDILEHALSHSEISLSKRKANKRNSGTFVTINRIREIRELSILSQESDADISEDEDFEVKRKKKKKTRKKVYPLQYSIGP